MRKAAGAGPAAAATARHGTQGAAVLPDDKAAGYFVRLPLHTSAIQLQVVFDSKP